MWASRYNDRAYAALAKAGANTAALQMAVLVQLVVAARYAWVAHTRHPVTGGHLGFEIQGLVWVRVAHTRHPVTYWGLQRNSVRQATVLMVPKVFDTSLNQQAQTSQSLGLREGVH